MHHFWVLTFVMSMCIKLLERGQVSGSTKVSRICNSGECDVCSTFKDMPDSSNCGIKKYQLNLTLFL